MGVVGVYLCTLSVRPPPLHRYLFVNELTLLQNTPTMSSREIAELCDKEHRHVCRDIRAYAGAIVQMERGIDVRSMDWDGKEGVELFEHTPIGGVTMKYEVNPQNKQTYPVYYLDKNATLTIITGYSILSDLAVKPPTSGGGYKAIINYCNLTFLVIKCKA